VWNSVVVGAQLRLRGYSSTRRSVELTSPRRVDQADINDISRITLGVVRRLPWSVNCLERSLLLMRMLRLYGSEPLLRLGVRRLDPELEFHAWVETNGVVLGDHENVAQTFRPFGGEQLPPDATFV
jgi:hypothetical protein